jgi:hypothetical protein
MALGAGEKLVGALTEKQKGRVLYVAWHLEMQM